MSSLKKAFAAAGKKYKGMKKAAEARVVRWEWATFTVYEAEPYYHERNKIPRGRVLKTPPAKSKIKEGMHQYGFDADGRIAVVRTYGPFKGACGEEFFTPAGPGRVDGVLFDDGRRAEVGNVSRQTYDRRGRLVRYEFLGTYGESTETYAYDGEGRLAKIRTRHLDDLGKVCRIEDDLEYDALGRLSTIRRKDSPKARPYVLYRRPQKGESVKELAEVIRERLVRAIPKALRAARVKGPVYAVILLYTKEDAAEVPPPMAVGREKERRGWSKELGRDAKYKVWNAAEFTHDCLTPKWDDAVLTAACERFNQRTALSDNAGPARKLLNDVARDLAAADWSTTFDVTDDFVIFATDYGHEDFRANLKASVDAKRLAVLRKRDWL